jgi:hypothetical protein
MQTLLTGSAGQPAAKPIEDALGRVTGFTRGTDIIPLDPAGIEAQKRVASLFSQ